MGDHLFFSYSWQDRSYAQKLADRMREAGLRPWLFEHDEIPSEQYVPQLMAVIEDAAAVIVILSPYSANSMAVQQEVLYAMDKRKRIIPVLYADGDGPVRFLLRVYNWVDARDDQYPIGALAEVLAFADALPPPAARLVAIDPYAQYVRPNDIVIEVPHHARVGLQIDAPREVTLCTIGVLPNRTMTILPSQQTISKCHAHICARKQDSGEWDFLLYDTSKNGTFINGQRITSVHRLQDGDVIGLARDTIILRFMLLDRTATAEFTMAS